MGKAKHLRQLKKVQARREQRTRAMNAGAVETLDAIPVKDRIKRRHWEGGELRRTPLYPGRYAKPAGTCPRCKHQLWKTSQGDKTTYCQGCGWR